MTHLYLGSMQRDYSELVGVVRDLGYKTSSRGLEHREIEGMQVRLANPYLVGVDGIGRKSNSAIGWVEGLQLVAGESYPNLMTKVAGNFERFKNGEVFHGSYGPRIRSQMPMAIERLMNDPGTRQAVVSIWDPLHDNQSRRDVPCTLGFQFLIRNERLVMITNMRSNDVWLGFPYDVFQFTLLQKTVANCLGLRAGTYVHNVGSMHLYESDVDKTRELSRRNPTADEEVDGLQSVNRANDYWYGALDRWNECRSYACGVLDGHLATYHEHTSLGDAHRAIHGS